MQVEIHTDPIIFKALREEWDDLLSHSLSDTLFLRPAWQEAWWQVFGAKDALRIITVRDGAGRLVGVAPLFLAAVSADASEAVPALSYERPVPNPAATIHRTLLLVGGTEVSDYLDLIVERAQATAVYEAIFEGIQSIAGWEWLDLRCLPEASPTPTLFGNLAAGAGLSAKLTMEDVCPFITLPDSWEGYLKSLSKKQRHELRRKMRRVEESGRITIIEANDPALLDKHLATFIALHQASTPDKADFMRDSRMRCFFQLVARAALENGWLNLSFLALNGEPAAAMFCFRYRDAALVYNSGFDPQAWPGLSPGVALLGYEIRRAIEAGRREFDFLQGNERYKYDLGAQDRVVNRLLIRKN